MTSKSASDRLPPRQPDRVPRQVYHPRSARAAQAHFGGADILQALDIDLRG